MKQFNTILAFELKYYFKNKIFVGVTIFLVALIAIVMFFPRITSLFSDKRDGQAKEEQTILISSPVPEEAKVIQQAFASAFPDSTVKVTEDSLDEIKKEITDGSVNCAFLMDGFDSYTYYVNNLSMYDTNTAVADEVLQNLYFANALTGSGLSAEEAGQILSVQIQHKTTSLGKDQMQNFFYTYIMIFALYMVILLYGQMVATNVATEKSSRAMEVLVTSAKPVNMMFGKVIASCLAGLTQLVVVFGSAFLLYQVNQDQFGENPIVSSIFDMPLQLLIYMLIFFVLGFFIYAFMFGAIGSTASKLEDINTSVMPVTMIFVVGFIVVIYSMTGGNVEGTLLKICSFLPFTSPMAMFTRIAMSTVPLWQICVSIGLLIASVIGIGILAAKIYRVGVLLYGTKPKFGAMLKAVLRA